MKVSTNLLTAIAFGVAIGATSTSCTLFDDVSEERVEVCDEECDEQCTEHRQVISWDSCPACGMG